MADKLEYPAKEALLISGEKVLFKLLEPADQQALLNFFGQVSEQEAETLRHDVRDPETVAAWVRELDYHKVVPLLAFDEGAEAVVGAASLHLQQGVYRHVADIRIMVSSEYRRLGLGSAMIKELVGVADRLRLHFIRAEILSDNPLAIKAFRQLGFEVKCTLDDYFMSMSGKTRDVVLLVKRMLHSMEEDFFYVF